MMINTPQPFHTVYGGVPPLTDAQSATIITIDLDNPPPFVRVLRDLSEVKAIVTDPQPGIGVWIYRPDWDSAAGLIDRGAARGRSVSGRYSLGQHSGTQIDLHNPRRVESVLKADFSGCANRT